MFGRDQKTAIDISDLMNSLLEAEEKLKQKKDQFNEEIQDLNRIINMGVNLAKESTATQ